MNSSISRSAAHRVRCAPARTMMQRQYATGYQENTQKVLKTSSRLTWITTSLALAAGLAYFSPTLTPSRETIKHTKYPDLEAPKPVEDRHGDTVAKHSIAAKKNQERVREGVFKGGEFDNHVLKHTTDPEKDFEKK